MKKIIKSIIKSIIPESMIRVCYGYKSMMKTSSKKVDIFRVHILYDSHPDTINSVNILKKILNKINPLLSHYYIYPYDPLQKRILPSGYCEIVSITPDYKKIIESRLSEKEDRLIRDCPDSQFKAAELGTISIIKDFAARLAETRDASEHYPERIKSIPDLLDRDCRTLDEAIQKLLFYNGLLWQYGHRHNGLGRLDMILYPYYKRDVESGRETYDSAKQRIKDMCMVLGAQTKAKSMALIGDTGQYILLGGIDESGKTVENDLTNIFLEVFTEIHIPDPKLILRVNGNTSDKVWDKAISCLATGSGSPLIMNETPIMKRMAEFGYSKADVWNVGTSACWEPLIIGKSADQNNPFRSIVACEALNKVLEQSKSYKTFDDLLDDVKKNLAEEAESVVNDLKLDYSPILSLFSDSSITRGKDYFHGGSEYMYQGAQVVGLPNLVNSLMNMKDYVFDNKLFTLEDCRTAIKDNYDGYEDMRKLFQAPNRHRFGSTDAEVESITDMLISCVSDSISDTRSNGTKVKFGLSSPNYIAQSKNFPATLDGRKAGEPFAVHISPVSSEIDINEVLHFASEIHYPANCINGNVTDFIIPPAYLKEPEKLAAILKDACSRDVNQIQLNVLDKETLIDAKSHPDKYPDLIVRVWGFSAYFNDLPEEYKDYLIRRADTYGAAA